MKKQGIYLFLLIFSLSLLGCASTGPGTVEQGESGTVALEDVTILDNAVELHLSGNQAPSFTVYKASDPYIVVVDLPGVELGEVEENIMSDKVGISEVRLTEMDEELPGARVEVLLETPGELDAEYAEGMLLLSVAGAMMNAGAMGMEPAPDEVATGMAAEEMEESMLEAEEMGEPMLEAEEVEEPMLEAEEMEEAEAEEGLPAATQITNIYFDYSDGHKRLVFEGDGAMKPDVFTLDGKIVLDVPDVSMAAEVPDAVVAPVSAIRQGMYENKVRFIIDLKEKVAFIASVENDYIILAFPVKEEEVAGKTPAEEMEMPAPPIPARRPAGAEAPRLGGEYVGKRISLDFQDADVKPIIRLLAGDVGGFNVVLHPQVSGQINLRLKDVPWDKALDIILKQNNLSRLEEENIMWVAPTAVFRQQEEEEAKRKQTSEKVAEIKQEIIHLNYISADAMRNRIEEAKVKSPRGQIRIDERTNNLIINDTEESIKRIMEEEIPYWDTQEHGTMQVLIEAKIVEVSTLYSRQLGIRWSSNYTRTNASGDIFSTTFGVDAPIPPLDVPGAFVDTNVIEVGSVSTVAVNLRLEALESVQKTRKLANPKVLTIDKLKAVIKQGVQIPFTTIEDGTSKTEFEEAVLKLEVTPEIQPNGVIKLDVMATNDTPVQVGGETGINNQEIETRALVKDTETLVLGGIYTNTESKTEDRIPWLGKIPLFGWLFKTERKSAEPKELLVFITPRIVR